MSKLQVEVVGLDDVRTVLSGLVDAVDVETVLDESQAIMLNRIRTRFLRQEAPDGSTWPISQGAIKRAQTGRGGGTLFDTGRLFHSIQAFDAGKGERRIGTDVSYGRDHQFGIAGQYKREFLGFSDDDVKTIELLVGDRIQKALG